MKKNLLMLFFIIILSFFSLFSAIEHAYADSGSYAQILKDGVLLYRSPVVTDDFSNIYFEIEKTYFVELVNSANDIFYEVRYLNVYGYVKKSDIQCVKGTPNSPYPSTISFRIFALEGLNMRSEPSQIGGPFTVITAIPFLENNIQYYGAVNGEEAVPYKGTKWYFCRYIKNGESYTGYVYSVFCDMLTTIKPNMEILEYVNEPDLKTNPIDKKNTGDEFSSLSSFHQILIIIGIAIPCIGILYLLFKPTRITVKALNGATETKEKKISAEHKKKYKKLKRQDYYEYDE